MTLQQSVGLAKTDAESVMGGAGWQAWRMVNLPFREKGRGDRQWNIDAAQFSYEPGELAAGADDLLAWAAFARRTVGIQRFGRP